MCIRLQGVETRCFNDNIRPRPEPKFSTWQNLRTHETVGKSMPGYSRQYGEPAGTS